MYIVFLSAVFHKYLLNEILFKKIWGQYIVFLCNEYIYLARMHEIDIKVTVKAFIILHFKYKCRFLNFLFIK